MKITLRNFFYFVIITHSILSLSADGVSSSGEIKFIALQEGVTLEGKFSDFESKVEFDPRHLDGGMVRVRVDARSVNTGTAAANELIRSADFFNVVAFPQATFEASEFHTQDAEHYIAKGTFTLKGHSVTLPVTFTMTSGPLGRWFDGSFNISRTSFKVGQGEWSDTSTLDDTVKIQFHILQSVDTR